MNKLICLVALWLPGAQCFAQNLQLPFSDAYTGMGTYSSQSADAFSFQTNQASLARVREMSGGIYAERLYSIRELTLYSGVFVKPLSKGAIGLGSRYSGNSAFQYFKFEIGYGISLSGDIDIGLQFNYSRYNMPGYTNSQTLTGEIGLLTRVTERLFCGIHLSNIVGGLLNRHSDYLPSFIFSYGIGYEISEKLLIKCDLSKEYNMPVLLAPGIQYNIKKEVFFRSGIIAETGTFIAGAGLKWRNMRADLAASWHSRLGITPSVLIIIY